MFDATFWQPIRDKQKELADVTEALDKQKKDLVLLSRQSKNLETWKKRSLPPDPVTSPKQRPEAVNAQRLYQDWLHDLAQLSGFEDLEVRSERTAVSSDNVFVSVDVKIKATARYEQICRFLDRFYRADLLHRVSALRIQSRESDGDPQMEVELDAEGVAIVSAPQNRRLFAQTTIDDDLSEDATEMTVESTEGFPEKPGFQVRLRDELVNVTAMNGTTWTIERAQDATTSAAHSVGTIVELQRFNNEVAVRSAEEMKRLLESSVFVKPAPPVQYKPRISPIGEKTLVRGKPIEFTIPISGYDQSKGRPEFSLLPTTVTGAKLEKIGGRFMWSPTKEQKSGKYAFRFEVKHPSIAGGKLTDTINIVLRDPNTPPKITTLPTESVFIGRPWKVKLQATDAESAATRLSWKLGENAPEGMRIESRTGELTWTPDDTTDVGETSVQVSVTDDGTPAQTSSATLKLKVQDDAATFTYLTTIFSVNGKTLAKLYDRSQNKTTELRVGSTFAVADIKGSVTKIDRKFLLFDNSEGTHRLNIGQSLRELLSEKPEVIADALLPANVPVKAEEAPAAEATETGDDGPAVEPPATAKPAATETKPPLVKKPVVEKEPPAETDPNDSDPQ
jgi:hypothetical protein